MQRRRVLQAQLAADAPLQEPVRGLEALERGRDGIRVAQDAHVHASVAQVGAGLDVRDGDKSHAWILQFMAEHVAEDLSHGLIDTPHPLRGHPIPPASSNEVRLRSTRTLSGKRPSSHSSTWSVACCSCLSEPLVSAPASVARCHVSCPSTSDTARPSRVCSCAFTDESSLRLDFRLSESGKCRWMSSRAT